MPPSSFTPVSTTPATLAAGTLPRAGWLVPASLLFLLLLLSRWTQPSLGHLELHVTATPLSSLLPPLALRPTSAQ